MRALKPWHVDKTIYVKGSLREEGLGEDRSRIYNVGN